MARIRMIRFVPVQPGMAEEADPEGALSHHLALPHQGTLGHHMRHARMRRERHLKKGKGRR